tara:strand:+ start:419 stop:610 length:192 start_codon:yes stop_codon:yes gene_type:complete
MPNPTPTEIKQARLDAGLTQTEFGALVDSAMRTVQDWEAGKRNMPSTKWKIIKIELAELKKSE